jgi:hypothetical protein
VLFKNNPVQILKYSNKVLTLNKHSDEECAENLEGEINGNYCVFKLPSKSTLYVGKGINFNNIIFKSIELY